MSMDIKALEEHVLGILEAIGEDPNREGLKETPHRVAKMLAEVLEGTAYSNHEIAQMFGKTFTNESCGETEDAVVMKDITVFSYCEHHLALMYDMKVNVAYIPRDRVIGLSKIARICDMAAKRLQLQERLGRDIAGTDSDVTGPPEVRAAIIGWHCCMTARGIKNASSKTLTTTYIGAFKTDSKLKELLKFDN